MTERLITPEDVEQRWGINVAAQRKLRSRRLLPFVRLGHRSIRYKPSEIDAAIQRFTVPACWQKKPLTTR